MTTEDINKCYNCIFNKQKEYSTQCTHENKVDYKLIEKQCECGRKPNENTNGCGRCIGRGRYTYIGAYDDCDCGGFKLIAKN